jgi:outer membrane immunogenic protein
MLAAVAAFGTAQAADIPVKAPVYKPACAQFGGINIGIHGDATSHTWNWQDMDNWRGPFDVDLNDNVGGSKTGGGVGVQLGYNWQRGCTVWGFEADWTWARVNDTRDTTDGGVGGAADQLIVNSDVKWYGTLRARTGVVVDNLLIYATGGLFYARVDYGWTACCSGVGVGSEAFTDNNTRLGWTAGVGTEMALWSNWSFKSEALYAQLPTREVGFSSPANAVPNKRARLDDSFWIARFGLNYRFGGNR